MESAPAANASSSRPSRGSRGGRGGRGGARGGRKGAPGADSGDKDWTPVTKLGRLVKDGKIASMDEIYRHSLPVKEFQIIDHFFGKTLTDEVIKIMPVQKQTKAGQRTRFKAFVIIGDSVGHVGLGVKCAKEVATAIRGAIILAKLSIVPVRLGYWGNVIGAPHTVPAKVSGKCGSVRVRLVPAPRGTGLVCAPTMKRFLELAGIADIYTQSRGSTRTLGNFVKATLSAIASTHSFQSPEMWSRENAIGKSPFEEHSDHLARATLTASRRY